VLDLEALGDDSDGGPIVRAQRLEDQQELVLLRLDAGRAGGGLAEGEKATELVAQLGEGTVLRCAEITYVGHG
jgi:hypothetical protein